MRIPALIVLLVAATLLVACTSSRSPARAVQAPAIGPAPTSIAFAPGAPRATWTTPPMASAGPMSLPPVPPPPPAPPLDATYAAPPSYTGFAPPPAPAFAPPSAPSYGTPVPSTDFTTPQGETGWSPPPAPPAPMPADGSGGSCGADGKSCG